MNTSWKRTPKYPLLPDRPRITNHKQLPAGVRLVGQTPITSIDPDNPYLFYENNGGLSVISVDERPISDDIPYYNCIQWDLPLEFLTWFPQTLTAYRLPPGQSPYRGMTTPDMDVGGEMLSLSRGMAIGGDGVPGYNVDNWSRHWEPNYQAGAHFTPVCISWTEPFLFEGGAFAAVQELGQKWQKGIL